MKDNTITKIVKELHECQGDNMKLVSQLEFMNGMVQAMAKELASIENVDPQEIIEEYTIKVYEQQKKER